MNEKDTYIMTPEQKALIKATVAEVLAQHPCHFTEMERKHVHELSDAMIEEGGNGHTFRVIVQLGNSYRDVTKSFQKWGIVILVAFVVVVMGIVGYMRVAK